jgi:hypothetical protein
MPKRSEVIRFNSDKNAKNLNPCSYALPPLHIASTASRSARPSSGESAGSSSAASKASNEAVIRIAVPQLVTGLTGARCSRIIY